MKRLSVALFALFLTIPVLGTDEDQSYISYDSGDTTVIQAVDNREVEVGVNSPVFAGDQVVTARRGRVEIRLSDGNIMAIDRRTAVLFHAMQGSYGGEDNQTIAELLRGKLIVHQTDVDFVPVRLDTKSATYESLDESIVSIETDGYRDEVSVFGGLIEVRTREGAYRLRAGERVFVDEKGIYDSSGLARDGMDDFERWYLRRSDDGRGHRSRYLDRRLSYAEPMLDSYGSWVYVQDYGSWVWRPRVSVGWKPYYHGRWTRGRSGALVWVSYEPWGWVPYHYGRWTYSSFYGWVWVPGSVYSPAWVYWAYGPSWVGWVPWGYYDCYTPYYNWLYKPRRTIRVGVGFGFWGRVHVSDRDLNHWVVVGPDHLVSTRVDRAALTTDRIRDRLQRDGNRATFTDTPARFTRDELRNPREAVRTIARRVPGEGTGNERSGSEVVDATRFFRRDPDLSNTLRERIVRSRPDDSERSVGGRSTGNDTRGDRTPGSVISRDPGGETPGNVERPGISERPTRDGTTRTITRDRTPRQGTVDRGTRRDDSADRVTRPATPERSRPSTGSDRSPSDDDKGRTIRRPSSDDQNGSWRTRELGRTTPDRSSPSTTRRDDDDRSSSVNREWRETPVPGRVIDSIGGPRLVPSGSSDREAGADRTRPTDRRPVTTRERGSSSDRSSRVTRERTPSRSSSVDRDRSSSRSSKVDRSSSSRSRTTTRSSSGSSSRSSSTRSKSSSSRSSSSSAKSSRSSSSSSKSSSRGKVSRSKPDDR